MCFAFVYSPVGICAIVFLFIRVLLVIFFFSFQWYLQLNEVPWGSPVLIASQQLLYVAAASTEMKWPTGR